MKRKLHSRRYAAFWAGKLSAGPFFRTLMELHLEWRWYRCDGLDMAFGKCQAAYLAGRAAAS